MFAGTKAGTGVEGGAVHLFVGRKRGYPVGIGWEYFLVAVECGTVLCGLLSSRVAAKRKLHLDAGELDWRDAVGDRCWLSWAAPEVEAVRP